MKKILSIVSDCGGQAMDRMASRYQVLNPEICITGRTVVATPEEAGGNIVDQIDAGANIVVCNSAPREETAGGNGNGSEIAFAEWQGRILVSTLIVLGLMKKVLGNGFPAMRVLDTDRFMREVVRSERERFNFRGLEVLPYVVRALLDEERDKLDGVSTLLDSNQIRPPKDCIWLADEIMGIRYNLKTTTLRDEVEGFQAGATATVELGWEKTILEEPKVGIPKKHEIPCYERLTDIPKGDVGLYEGSSGYGNHRFLEIAVNGGSAAHRFGVTTGAHCRINEIK